MVAELAARPHRSPPHSSLPAATGPVAITAPSTTTPSPTRALTRPRCRLHRATSITAPSNSTDPSTRAPGRRGARAEHRSAERLGTRLELGAGKQQGLPARARQRGGGQPAEHQVAGSADERLGRSDIEPVRGLRIPHHDLAGRDERGEGRPFHRNHLPGWYLVDHPPPEDVAAGVDPVRQRPRRLLQERRDPPAGVGGHAAEPRRVGDLD